MFTNLKTNIQKSRNNYFPAILLILAIAITIVIFIYRKKIISRIFKTEAKNTTPLPIEQLNKFAIIEPNMQNSQEVVFLQSELKKKGYNITISGNADTNTMSALAQEGYLANPPLAFVSVLLKTKLGKI